MIEVEKSLLELNEIFNEMAVMMESQGGSENPDDSIKDQTLDGIEDNVGGAQEYVEKGKQQLAKAEEHKKILKIKNMILIIILLVVAVIIVLSLIPTFT